MTDDLRTRIAKALYSRVQELGVPTPNWHSQPAAVHNAWYDDADAVIRELGLEVERGGTYEVGGKASSYRYVTDWMTDD
jgi:hypothetical protein